MRPQLPRSRATSSALMRSATRPSSARDSCASGSPRPWLPAPRRGHSRSSSIVAGARRHWHGLRRGQQLGRPDRRRRPSGAASWTRTPGSSCRSLQHIPYAMPARDPDDPGRGAAPGRVGPHLPAGQGEQDAGPPPGDRAARPPRRPPARLERREPLGARPADQQLASDAYPSEKFELLDRLPDPVQHLPSSWPATDPLRSPTRAGGPPRGRALIAADQVEAACRSFRVVRRGAQPADLPGVVRAVPRGIELFAPSAALDPDLFRRGARRELSGATWASATWSRPGLRSPRSRSRTEPHVSVDDPASRPCSRLAERAGPRAGPAAIIATAT